MAVINPGSYGICALSVVPIRAEPSDKAEIGTQLLFGDVFSILRMTEDKRWLFIQNEYDAYEGWIDFKQYKPVSQEYFEEHTSNTHPVCRDLMGFIESDNGVIPILFGSTIPFYNNGMVDLGAERLQFKGACHYPTGTNDFRFLEKTARQYLGAPYLWGGKGHFGIDCSGLVQQVYKMSGYKLPRDAWQQAEVGIPVELESIRPGDLALFNNPQGRIVHVGIALEAGNILHASGEVRIDVVDAIGIFNKARNGYSHKLFSIRRILN